MKRNQYNEDRWLVIIIFFIAIPTLITAIVGEYLFEAYWKAATLVTLMFTIGVNYQLVKNKQDAAFWPNVHPKLD